MVIWVPLSLEFKGLCILKNVLSEERSMIFEVLGVEVD